MIRICIVLFGGLTIAMSGAVVASGQSFSPLATKPYNPFSGMGGQIGNLMQQTYRDSTGSASLNQQALRNAQESMQQSYSPPSGMSSAGRIGTGLGNSYSGSKPFSGFSQGPAVSPYLNLFRIDTNGMQGFNYSTLVAPELRQQQLNQQQQAQNTQTSRRLQAIAAQAAYNPQGSKEELPTGHQTVFQYTGHYYPQQPQRQKKR